MIRVASLWPIVCFWYGLVAFNVGRGQAVEPVGYTVKIDAPHTHYLQVEAHFRPESAGDLELFLPVWTPGSYLVREYARLIDSFQATDVEGQSLAWEKVSKNRWTIRGVPATGAKVSYRVYANELSVRTNYVDAEFAILAGAATFLTSPQLIKAPHTVQLQLPNGWQQSVTPLKHPEASPAHFYIATDYDTLVDSPILMGNPKLYPFRVGEVQHYLVNQGGDPFWDGQVAAADAAKIVAEHQRMWGSVPYEQYFFFNLIAESGGGLEHDNSTVVITSRWSFLNDRNYKRWLGLISHEFFHAWNVRRLRPKALAQYAYETEVYFDELWVAEGITSYYDELALARAGLNSPTQYLTALSKEIETLQNTTGRARQSLAESSHDAWIKFYRPDENSSNTAISYYNKGAVVAFLLDTTIRQRTQNAKSLDDVMRTLYARYAKGVGFTNQDVASVASEVAGSDLSPWLLEAVNTTQELDYQPALAWLGLEFKPVAPSSKSEGDESAKPGTSPAAPPIPWLGITLETKEGKTIISRIVEGSPGFAAGLNVNDELIGLGGFRLTEPLEDRLKFYQTGQMLKVLVARRGQLLELPVTIGARPTSSWSLQRVAKPDPQQTENFNRWLRLAK